MGYSGGSTSSTSAAIANTATPALYQTERWSQTPFQYQFAVPAGSYQVNLKFSENSATEAGQRIFNVLVNGRAVLANFDIFASAGGGFRALDQSFAVALTGQMVIQFVPVTGAAKIDALEIRQSSGGRTPVSVAVSPASATLSVGQFQQFTANVTGSINTAVSWSLNSGAPGTISSSGLYTAPSSVASPQTVTVTATSVADTSKTATASVTIVPPVQVTVSPSTTSLIPSGTQQFTAAVTGTLNTAVTWQVSPAVGTISSGGLYNAPATLASPQTVTVTATSVADTSKSATASVTVVPPVLVTVSPSAASLIPSGTQQFTAAVIGTTNTTVTWSVSPAVGTISGSGLYSAPATLAIPQTVTVTATSVADASKSATASVTIVPPVQVTVSPSTTSLAPSGTQQFTAAVIGTTNTAVTWSVTPAVGTISSGGLYSAPATLGSPQTVTVTATSVADTSKSATASVTIVPPVLVTVSPATTSLIPSGTQQFTATVIGTTNTAVTWQVSPAVGTISGSGLYNAPATLAIPQTVTVTATSVADGTKTATATVTVNPAVAVTTAALPDGKVGTAYSATLAGSGGAPPYSWSILSGQMAPGLGLTTTSGVIYGTPTTAGVYTLTVQMSDAAGQQTSKTLSIAIAALVAISVSPATATLTASQTQQFTAAVTGATNTAVTWSVTPAVGAISSSGLYSAPATLASPQTVTVTATSVADTSGKATASVTIIPSVQVTVSPSTTSLTPSGTQQFTAAVTGTTNTAVTWSLNPPLGTISQSGLYTAPASVNAAQGVTVIAASAADSSKSALAYVNITPLSISSSTGGLVSYPIREMSANLLTNPGFEQRDPATGRPVGWKDDAFNFDTTVAHSGLASCRLTDANLIPYAQSNPQTLQLRKGIYRIGGWVKTGGLAATRGDGVRLCLYAPAATWPPSIGSGCTSIVKGTADWQYLQLTGIVVSQDTSAQFILQAYGDPDGSAWFDDVELRREYLPLEVSLLYPNYRGMLFDDQSQTARFNIALDLPNATPADFGLTGQVSDESTGSVILKNSFPSTAALTASFDLSSLILGRSYLVGFSLIKTDGSQTYSYPAYRIVKVPGSLRASMTVSFDEQNRFLLHGKPSFLLGAYDAGMGYTATEPQWETQFTTQRRLFELPINFYLNYWYGLAPNSAWMPMLNVLQRHGIYALTSANCFQNKTMEQIGPTWLVNGPDSVVRERTVHPAFGGFYAADECSASLIPDVFGRYQQMKTLDPGGMVLGVQGGSHDLPLWRDSLDVLAADSYPMYGAEPAEGYPFHMVADDAKSTYDAVFGSRPFVTVLQYFQFTSQGRWPTQAELRSMSYAAIAGGANGLFYWSLGANALAYICDGSDAYHSPAGSGSWCQARVDNHTNLKNVLTELQALSPALTMPDRPDLLAANSNPIIRTRVKYDGTTAYLIAYNASNSPQSATFRWSQTVHSVSVPQEGRLLQPSGGGMADTFVANGVHVYVIQ
jgi:hypothetical protein